MLPSENRTNNYNSLDPDALSSNRHTKSDLSKFSFKQKAILMSTLSSFEPEKTPKSKPLAGNMPHTHDKKSLKDKFKVFKEKQLQNFKKLQKNQKKSQIELSHQMMKVMKEHIDRELMIDQNKRIQAREREENYQKKQSEIQERKIKAEEVMENDIIMKLEKFEGKKHISEGLHNEFIKEKLDNLLKLREATGVFLKHQDLKKSNEAVQLKKMFDKHQLVKLARDRIDERINKLAMDKKEEFEKKHSQALEKLRNTESEFYLKSKGTEKKIMISQKIISERKEKMHEKLAKNQELKRLKDYEGMIKIQRAKRKFVKIT